MIVGDGLAIPLMMMVVVGRMWLSATGTRASRGAAAVAGPSHAIGERKTFGHAAYEGYGTTTE